MMHDYENHLSLLEKIDFRVKNNLAERSSRRVIKQILQHSLLNVSTDFFARKGEARKLIVEMKSANLERGVPSEFKDSVNQLIQLFSEDEKLDGRAYFDTILKNLSSYLVCEHSLEHHKKSIEYCTKLLIAEFIRVGFSTKDFTASRIGILNRVISKKIDPKDNLDNNFFVDPYLPEKIEALRGKKGFQDAVKSFVENIDAASQFQGFYLIYAAKKITGKFLFRISGIQNIKEGFRFKIGQVEFLHPNEFKIDTSSWRKTETEIFNDFKDRKEVLLAIVPSEFKSHIVGLERALATTQDAVDFMNYNMVSNDPLWDAAKIDNRHYMFVHSNNNKFKYHSNSSKAYLNFDQLREKTEFLYPEGFEAINEEAKNTILRNDHLLFKIKLERKLEKQISSGWQFLESFFAGSNIKDEKMMKHISRSLILNDLKYQQIGLECLISNGLLNSHFDGKSNRQQIYFHLNAYDRGRIDFSSLKSLVEYPFIQELFDQYENLTSGNVDHGGREKFYRQLLFLIYEQRNIYFHKNLYCPSSTRTLRNHLSRVLHSFRSLIVEKLISKPEYDLISVITELKQEGQGLIEGLGP